MENEAKSNAGIYSKLPELKQKMSKAMGFLGIKTSVAIAVVIVAGALAWVYKGVFVVAIVDGSPITRLSVVKELEKGSGKRVLDSIIVKKLIEREAVKNGISVSAEDVDGSIKKVEEQIASQGGTLEMALAAQGMSREDFEEQIAVQKKIEKLIADKINVSDEEIAQFVKDNKIEIPKGQEDVYKEQIMNQLKNQKMNEEFQKWIEELKTSAKIQYFVKY